MKLLKISESAGHFLNATGGYTTIDQIRKEDLLRLANLTLHEDAAEYDQYDEELVKNQAHQVIYKSVCLKLVQLRARKKEFLDESARLFLEDYERYRTKTDGFA
jgi:hypothetical protein